MRMSNALRKDSGSGRRATNVSQACERGLVETIAEARAARWLEENREALESSNAWVREHGLPLAKYRMF